MDEQKLRKVARAAFIRHAKKWGFRPGDVGRYFNWHGKTYRLIGLRPRSPRYPMIIEDNKTGKIKRMGVRDAQVALDIIGYVMRRSE